MPEPPRKRRAVRKGTRNCWECKRRKVRCIFTTPSSAACENCIHRNTTCISQEFELQATASLDISTTEIEARLTKVEHLLQQILNRTGTSALVEADDAQEEQLHAHMYDNNEGTDFLYANDHITPSITPPATRETYTSISNVDSINQTLIALWPNEYDLNYVYKLPPYLSTELVQGTTTAVRAAHNPANIRAMLRLPKPGSHPVLLARKLLMLGSMLQGALSLPDVDAPRRERFKQLMLTILDTVKRSVTKNEEIVSSIEGLECIMFEALMQNHSGQLHQAWTTLRRATTVAQTLGLHRDAPLRPEIFIDPASRDSFDTENFCFRVICMDRYLSMTLGLPHASYLPYAKTPKQLAVFAPIDRMARLQCIIAERLLDKCKKDTIENRDIDLMLLHAAAEMPHDWWLIPEPDNLPDTKTNHSDTVARFTYQMSHSHLLLRLYMPCVFQSVNEPDHGHGKRVAWSASRKILSCFLAFRKWNQSDYYCRGMDFLALIALTVLCVSHIDARRSGASSSTELLHSYPTDRATMQQILELMQRMKNDELASKLAKMIQSLLDIEADAANGTEYSAPTVNSSEGATEYQSELLDGGLGFQFRIPYFGSIVLRRTIPDSALNSAIGVSDGFIQAAQDTSSNGPDYDVDWSQQAYPYENWTLQNVNQALFFDLCKNV